MENTHPPLQHIKTELSENDKEQNTTRDANFTSFLQQQSHSNQKYLCSICSKVRLSCPCPLNQSVSSFAYKMASNSNQRTQRIQMNKRVQQNLSVSVPKITFSYAEPKQLSNRRHSLNISLSSHNAPQYQLKSVTTTTFIPPVEEIIYYPVVHNRIKYETPEKIVRLKERKEQSKTHKSRRRSYLGAYSPKMNEGSTRESKQPMTPQQFRKLTDWMLLQK